MTRTVLVFACLGVALTMACRTAPILSPDAPLAPPPSANLAEIRKAVIAAGTELGWVIQPQSPGVALGTLQLRDHEAVVRIHFSKQSVRIEYVSSENLLHSGDEIHRNYNNWVKNLRVHIQRQVAKIH